MKEVGIDVTPAQVAPKIRISFKGSWKPLPEMAQRLLKEPNIDYEKAWEFFNGACQGTPGMCGAGASILFYSNHCIFFKYAAGEGTNNRAEFFALCLLLKTAEEKGLNQLHVYGESKTLIDWANNKCRIEKIYC